MSRPRAFLSYSHDSETHRASVLSLAQKLRSKGVEAICDQYVNGSPPEGWPQWMLNEIEKASHVICICTETYYRRFRGKEEPGKGKGVTWEGAVISQVLYDSNCLNTKFIPAFINTAEESHLPEPLRGATYYVYERDFQRIYDAILGQAGVEPAELGELERRPRNGAAVSAEVAAEESSRNDTSLTEEPTEEELKAVFDSTVSIIESTLRTAPSAARFLGPEAPPLGRLVAQSKGDWLLLPIFRTGGADVCPLLESIYQRLPTQFTAARHEWDALERIIGGIIILGLDPRWVWQQRQAQARQGVSFPAFATDISLGEYGASRFLPILSAALAGGCARLERVFGPLDPRCIPDLNPVGSGITLEDRWVNMKRHFIRYVLGPRVDLDVEMLHGQELETLFRRIRQLFTVALKVDRDPYIGAGDEFTKLAEEVKHNLDAADFLLFIPTMEGTEFDLLTDPIIALVHMKRIHDLILKHRPNL